MRIGSMKDQPENYPTAAGREIRYWEYPGGMDLLYYLAEGNRPKDFPDKNPGEVSWEAFRWDGWKALLARGG